MDVVELLEYAHRALEDGPAISDELTRLRWEAFGSIVDALVPFGEWPVRSPRWYARKLDDLRDFCFLEALMRLEGGQGNLRALVVKGPMHLLAMLPNPFGFKPSNN